MTSPEVRAAHALRVAMRGTPIPLPHRAAIETRLKQPLGAVRCYTGPEAIVACRLVGARAFTVRDVIVFAEPSPPLEVALHEAVHVIQQGGDRGGQGEVPEQVPMASPTEASEGEAHALVDRTLEQPEGEQSGEGGTIQVHGESRMNGFFWLSGCSKPNESSTMSFGEKSVADHDGSGWLNAKVGSAVQAVPWHLKVKHTSRSGGRDMFTPIEGPYNGRSASVKEKSTTESYLRSGLSYTGAASVTLKKGERKMKYGSSSWFDAYTDPDNPIPAGTHVIELPDAPHSGGNGYTGQSAFATTWFRVGSSGDRYLHPGRVSAGCATVTDVSQWTNIYNYLIKSRASTTTVGSLTVQD
jgi:hypothetical protein